VKAPAEQGTAHGEQPTHRRPAAVRPEPAPTVPVTGGVASRIGAAAALRLQRQAGNRAVSRLVAQRKTGSAGPGAAQTGATAKGVTQPAAPSGGTATAAPSPEVVQRLADGGRAGPSADPKFAALKADVRAKQHKLAAHPPAAGEAAKAQKAAQAPPDDKLAQGKAAQAEQMEAAKPGEFNKAAFVKAVNDAINQQAPKNLDDADKFATSGKADQVKSQVSGQVTAGKQASAGAITSATQQPPDTSKAKDKPVTPLAPDPAPATPAPPNPAQAVPDKAPPAATDFSAGPAQVRDQMAEAQVTEEQLAKSNEPEFTGALKATKETEQHAATAPGQVRAAESRVLAGTKAEAAQTGAAALGAMAATRRTAGAAVAGGKQAAKSTDEAKRAQVTGILQKVFDTTKTAVEAILTGIDAKVDEKFSTGEKAARDAFTAEHRQKMKEYKDRRYSGWLGKGRWLRDKVMDLPAEANQIFVTARTGYVARMQQVIESVADVIAVELKKAKARIAEGRAQLRAEVDKLPKDLQKIGKQAAGDFAGKFDELTESVDNKGQELVQTLASKYTEALGAVDAEIAEEKEKNKGLVSKAVDAVGGAIKTILELKDLLLGVLAKAAEAVVAIIKDPIGFLGHLVSAVGAGLNAFMGRIGEHLQKGLVGWLMGSASSLGIQLPEKFDLKGIVSMIASLLGLTWDAIKARVIARGVPAQAIDGAEQSLPLIARLKAEGISGIWEAIVEKVGNLKDALFAKLSAYIGPEVLKAGIIWLLSLLNPASAFVKACKMIIDIVSFIVTRGAQIAQFVNAVLDAVIAIAKGGAGGVPQLIENALAKSIPVLIGGLAAILGIGGIADKVKKFIQSLSKPVMKAVDWVTDKIVGVGKKIWAKLKGFGRKVKDRINGSVSGRVESAATQPRESASGPVIKTVSMQGHSHRITFPPDGAVLMASVESGLVGKALARRSAIKDDVPTPTAEIEALDALVVLVRRSQEILRKKGADDPSFGPACDAVVAAVSAYAQKFRREDLDPTPASTEEEERWAVWAARAEALGFQRTNYRSHGAPVYRQGANRYISPDVDSHIGGVWKMATSVANLGSKKTRSGTYDADLKWIGK
jgi:hypothetical protein